jgi:hypothetical protein
MLGKRLTETHRSEIMPCRLVCPKCSPPLAVELLAMCYPGLVGGSRPSGARQGREAQEAGAPALMAGLCPLPTWLPSSQWHRSAHRSAGSADGASNPVIRWDIPVISKPHRDRQQHEERICGRQSLRFFLSFVLVRRAPSFHGSEAYFLYRELPDAPSRHQSRRRPKPRWQKLKHDGQCTSYRGNK